MGDIGTCDYAIANRFQMAYADYRNQLQTRGQCQGKAIVINWPFWKDGGMGQSYGDATKMFLKLGGQRAITNEEGIALFDHLLVQHTAQHMVMAGQREKIYSFLGMTEDLPALHSGLPVPSTELVSMSVRKGRREEMQGFSMQECVEWDLKEHVNQILKVPVEQIDAAQHLVEFGFDSISLAAFAGSLTRYYGIEIPPILFFGFPTIEKLAIFLQQEYSGVMEPFYQETVPTQLLRRASPEIKQLTDAIG